MRSAFILFSLVVAFFSCGGNDTDVPNKNIEIGASNFSELLLELEAMEASERQQVVEVFLDTLSKVPIIEGDQAYFIYTGEATTVKVAGDFNFWNPIAVFSKVEGTMLWYYKQEFPSEARLDYKLVINDQNWMLDPLNPNQTNGGFGPNSELAMTEYVQPWEIVENEATPKGTVTSESLSSINTGATYDIKVYTPPGYDENVQYSSVYFQDGGEYISLGSASIVLDNLIETGLIEPVVGIFVTPTNRNVEYAGEDKFNYRDFFVDELVPYITSNYSVQTTAYSRAVLGDSYGGNISAIIAFSRPEVFGNCGLHSGAFQANEFETNDLVMESVKDIKVASIWGSYEGGLSVNMRGIKDHFVTNGYDLLWEELPEGHSWGLWRATIDDMLIHFFQSDE